MVTIDQHARVTSWAADAEALFGWPAAEALGRPVVDLIAPPALRAAHARALADLLAACDRRGRRTFRVRAAHRSEGEFPAEVLTLPYDDAGAPAAALVVRRTDAPPPRPLTATPAGAGPAATSSDDVAAALISAAPVGVCTLDAAGTVQTWNAACERIFGWAADEIVGRPAPLGLDRESREFGGLWSLLLAGESFADLELSERRKDGSRVDVSLAAAPLRGTGGAVRGAVAVVVDVTERRRAEEEQQKFVSLVENSTDLVAMLSADGRLVYLNETGRRLVGLDAVDSVVGMGLGDLHTPDGAARLARAALPAALADGAWAGELELCHRPTGRRIDVRGSLFRVYDGAGRPLCLAAVCSDLTQQKRDAEALQRRDALLEAVARATARLLTKGDLPSAVGDAIRIIGQATGVDQVRVLNVHGSPATGGWLLSPLFRWCAAEEADVAGAAVDPAPAPRVLPPGWYESLAAGRPVAGSTAAFAAAATQAGAGGLAQAAPAADMTVVMLPIPIDGAVWGVVSLKAAGRPVDLNDAEVTILSTFAGSLGGAIARHQSEGELVIRNEELAESLKRQAAMTQQLAEAIRGAEAANGAKSAFLAHMSHEIRTPMTAILGYADLLLEPDQTPDDRLNCVQTVRRNARHLLDLINDILDISKIEAGKMHVERVDCSPWRTVVDVASMMRGRALGKNLRFDVACDGEVPDVVRTDPTRLRQILINLVGNAIKFTDAGAVSLRLCAEASDAPPADGAQGGAAPSDGHAWLRFTVTDTGIGMTEQQVAHLFQPFSQADSSITRRFGGTGLGLSICKRLAAMLGGDLTVTTEAGKGSAFTLRIPAVVPAGTRMLRSPAEAAADDDEHATPARAGRAPGAALELSGRVLLAEDGVDNQRLLSLYLRKAGAEVVVVENGRLACEGAQAAVAAGAPFGVILMDMQMPELDGYAAATRLRREGYAGPIVALTAHAMSEDRAKCLNAGCTDYLTKPVARADLIEMVAKHLAATATAATPSEPATAPVAAQAGDASAATSDGGEPAAVADADVDGDPTVESAETSSLPTLRSDYHDDPEMRELVDLFAGALPAAVDTLRQALAEGRPDAAAAAAHQLKGTGGGYGFPEVTRLAAAAEAAARAAGADPAGARPAVEALIAVLRSVEGYCREQERYHG